MSKARTAGDGPPLEVLLVDDDPEILRVLGMGLERAGYHVRLAATAEAALRLAADPGVIIDVIVMDIVLPDSWGSQVAMEQAHLRPDVPVIFMSGHSADDVVLRASAGQEETHFLEKPFTIEALVSKIHKVLAPESSLGT